MILGEIYLKFRMLENFQLNMGRLKYDNETKRQLMKQSVRIVAEIDEMIKNNDKYIKYAKSMVKELKLEPLMKKVRKPE